MTYEILISHNEITSYLTLESSHTYKINKISPVSTSSLIPN